MGGDLPALAANASLLADPKAGRVVGIGAFPEAIEQNPVVYDVAFEMGWGHSAPELQAWMRTYVTARYGADVPAAQSAWARLLHVGVLAGGGCPFDG
jgi:alpha-N-acetylglucosaminidase